MIALALVMVVAADPQPNSLQARVDELRALKNKGQSKEAETAGAKLLQDLAVAVKGNPRNAETLVLLGRTQLYLDQNEAAALTFDEAIKLNPRDANAQYYRGFVARELDAHDAAVGFFRKATELDPKSSRNWADLGAMLAGVDKLDEAIDALKKAMALDPKDEFAVSLAGRLLMETGKGAEGIVLLEKALALEPRDALAAYNAGLYYQLNGKPKRALELFETVVKADPSDWHALTKLVQLHQALGDLSARDRRRAEVFALYKAGKTDAKRPDFCREQFELGGQRVLVFESFELKGERAVRYSFRIAEVPSQKFLWVISLGSYDFTTSYMRSAGELKPDERAWHLDGYTPDNSHKTYGIFTREPTYEETRAMVVDVLEGRLKPVSGTSMKK